MHPARLVRIFVPLALFALLAVVAQAAPVLPAPPAAPAPAPVAALDPDAATVWSPQCALTEVAVYESRIHIRCSQGVTDGAATIYFWAVPTTKTQLANRFLSIGSTALVAGRRVVFLYTPGDTSGAAFGCQAGDCRNVYAVVLQ